MGNREFDKKIRELIGGHSELPDIDSWDAIESSLDRRKKGRVIFFRRVSFAAAAIAACVVLFFMLNKTDYPGKDIIPDKVVVVAEHPSVKTGHPENESSAGIGQTKQIILGNRSLLSHAEVDEPDVLEADIAEGQVMEHPVSKESVTEESVTEKPVTEKPVTEDIATKPGKVLQQYTLYEDYHGKEKSKRAPSFAFSTNISPSTSNHSVSLMAMSQLKNGYAPNNVVSTIQKSYVPQEVISNTKFLMPVSVGLQMQLPLSNRFSAGTGVVYSMLFSHYDAISRDETRETQQTLHYLGFPLNLYYTVFDNENIRLYTTGGLMIEKGLYAYYKVMENGVLDTNGEMIDGLQWSLNAGIGAEFNVNRSLGLYFDPTFAYYFDNNQPLNIRTTQPLQFKFEVGLRFHL